MRFQPKNRSVLMNQLNKLFYNIDNSQSKIIEIITKHLQNNQLKTNIYFFQQSQVNVSI